MARAAQLGNMRRDLSGAAPLPDSADQTPKFAVRHYTVAEIASLWSLSPDAVRQIFEKEPGVLVLGETQPQRGKRRYTTLRIPEFVLDRVHRRLSRI
jgi:hypothetical protein